VSGRLWRLGFVAAGGYVVVLAVTGLLTDRPVRPLFDAIGGAIPYKWVSPPWYVGSTNIKPGASSTDIPFENGTSPLIGVNSEDAQIILNLPQGALPPNGSDTAVRTSFTPLDPKKLARPPGGMRADGNAYRVEMTYQPSGATLRQVTTSGNVVMVVPDEAEKMLFSADGKSWQELPTQLLGDPNTVGSAFNTPGYYLVGTTLPEFVNPNQDDDKKRVLGIAMIVGALALLMGFVLPGILRRSRAAQAATGRDVRTRRSTARRPR
jgi:hypothetical protein